MIKAVLFDKDGVLMDSEAEYERRRQIFFSERGIDASGFPDFYGSNNDVIWRTVEPNDAERRARLAVEFVERFKDEPMIYADYVYPAVRSILEALRARGILTALASSSPRKFIDRFLVTCEAYRVPVTILLAKADLAAQDPEAVAAFKATYESAGYSVLEVSALDGNGIEAVRELLKGHTTLLAGNSGVGKSTLAGTVEPGLDIRTGDISESHHKGRHTTTFSTMYPLSSGGYLIDTPGIKGFGLIDIADAELWHYFPEMMRLAPQCRFYNCTHVHEPGCAVREAVERGEISWQRYESYLKMLDDDDKYRK